MKTTGRYSQVWMMEYFITLKGRMSHARKNAVYDVFSVILVYTSTHVPVEIPLSWVLYVNIHISACYEN